MHGNLYSRYECFIKILEKSYEKEKKYERINISNFSSKIAKEIIIHKLLLTSIITIRPS